MFNYIFCNLFENVALPLHVIGHSQNEIAETVEAALEEVGLSGLEEHYPQELSGGEQQRACLARALIKDPDIILADEPTGNLDQANARQVGSLLLDMHEQEEMMLVVVTHSLELAAMLDRQYRLDDGKLVDP